MFNRCVYIYTCIFSKCSPASPLRPSPSPGVVPPLFPRFIFFALAFDDCARLFFVFFTWLSFLDWSHRPPSFSARLPQAAAPGCCIYCFFSLFPVLSDFSLEFVWPHRHEHHMHVCHLSRRHPPMSRQACDASPTIALGASAAGGGTGVLHLKVHPQPSTPNPKPWILNLKS